jgi:hypothetical protein
VQKAHVAKHGKKGKPKPINYGSASVAAFHAGPVTLAIRPSGAARAALAKGERLTVLVTIKFTPASGGTPITHTMSVVVKGSRPPAKRRK